LSRAAGQLIGGGLQVIVAIEDFIPAAKGKSNLHFTRESRMTKRQAGERCNRNDAVRAVVNEE
jgi:hypothetical protein